jgi:ribonuclease E
MKKEMLINVLQPEECRIAIIEDGVLEELYVERTSHESYTGNIYKGKIVNIEPAIQAAFVDFSVGRNGFLHVSDVEPQYLERGGGVEGEGEPSPRGRERDRKREPRRERDRPRDRDRSHGRGREPRRRAAPEASDAGGEGPLPPPRAEERPSERGWERERERPSDADRPSAPTRRPSEGSERPSDVDRPSIQTRRPSEGSERPSDVDRPSIQTRRPSEGSERPSDTERPYKRERPDQSIRGRRDRSTPPARRFGEGLVDPAEIEPERAAAEQPVHGEPEQAPGEGSEPPRAPVPASEPFEWPGPTQPAWEELAALAEPETVYDPGALEALETRSAAPEPLPMEGPAEEFAADEPFDPDLPPSRTERSRIRARPGEPGGGAGARRRAPSRAPRETDETPRAEEARGEPEFELDRDLPREEPPRRRGGRAAIRSRGEDWGGHDLPAAPELEQERPARGSSVTPAPGEAERGRPVSPERGTAAARGRALEGGDTRAPRDRERERPARHGRAGEPGYVPRRERQGSSDLPTGEDRYVAGWDWPEREVEREAEGMPDSRGSEGSRESETDFLAGPGSSRGTGPQRMEGRRRRRRGRRRERPAGPARRGPASLASFESAEPADMDESGEFGPAGSFGAGLAPEEHAGGGFGELELDEFAAEHELDDDGFLPGAATPAATKEPEIEDELEEEIRKEIVEIEELEREMGLRGPAEARPRRGEEAARGGRSGRGRLLAKPPIQEIFRRGDEVLVQVIKESMGTKGPTLSTYISIPGRYLVLMPGLNRVGVSRKIVDEVQRRKLRDIMLELNPPRGLGFIVRTAGLERTKRELARDLAYLLRLWKVILRRIKKSKAPTPIYQESDMIIRTIRDIFTSEIDTIWIDEPSAFERAQDFLRVVMPRFVNRLKLYDEKVPLFHRYGIEDEIAKIQRRHVPLPEGGSIVIDQTEALVAIDVNSGNFRVEDDAEKTAYEMNLRAAREIARQLRLRDLGGVIVNDFIDMREERHRRGVERALREAIRRDRARTKVLRMSAFGLIEMTRQRIRPSLKRSIYEDCRHCAGGGVVKTAESMAIDVMRLLALATHRDEIRRVVISVGPAVAAYLANRKRRQIARIETDCNMTVQIGFEENAAAEHLQIECYDAGGNEVRLLPLSGPGHKRAH